MFRPGVWAIWGPEKQLQSSLQTGSPLTRPVGSLFQVILESKSLRTNFILLESHAIQMPEGVAWMLTWHLAERSFCESWKAPTWCLTRSRLCCTDYIWANR